MSPTIKRPSPTDIYANGVRLAQTGPYLTYDLDGARWVVEHYPLDNDRGVTVYPAVDLADQVAEFAWGYVMRRIEALPAVTRLEILFKLQTLLERAIAIVRREMAVEKGLQHARGRSGGSP